MNWIIALLSCAGLLFAGSESPYFPWPNFAGILMLAAAALIARFRVKNEA
jgi:hypothetical protein